MKLLLYILASLLALSTSSTVLNGANNRTYFLVEETPGVFRKESLIAKPKDIVADGSVVKMYYYSKSMKGGVKVDLESSSSIQKTDFSNAKETIFIIHGWQCSHNTELNALIRNAYFSVKDVNVFVVDWSLIAHLDYVTAQASVLSIGRAVGKHIESLVSLGGLDLGKTVITGHSLGAHIAGVAGKALNGQCDAVVGLDPAGPLFYAAITENRIDKTSGKFVQIIHTNAGDLTTLGLNLDCGHSDYWPNGGHVQPGCLLDVTGLCSHSRAYEFFAESVKSGKFLSKSCSDWAKYESGACSNGKSSLMGQENIDKTASGNFYLATNDHAPFARG